MALKISLPSQIIFSLLTASYMLGYLAFAVGPCSTCFFISPHQKTALHLAAEGGHVDTVTCLVEKGANTNIKDKNEASE